MVNTRFTFLILLAFGSGSSLNILFLFPGANYSHKLAIWPLIMALTEKGHNITFLSSIEKHPEPNPNVFDVVPQFLKTASESIYKTDRLKDRREGKEDTFSNYESRVLSMCKNIFHNTEDVKLTELLERNQGIFDLAIVNIIYGECGFYVAHYLRIPKTITFDPSTIIGFHHGVYGLPLEASWIPDVVNRYNHPLTFWDRLRILYKSWEYYTYSSTFLSSIKDVYDTYLVKSGDDRSAPELVDLARDSSLFLINTHPTNEFARPLPPSFVYVGGMSTWKPIKPVPKEFNAFLNKYEKDGVIVMSFGSTIRFDSLDDSYLQIFFNTMKRFSNVGFIWRWDGPAHRSAPSNLLGTKWLPQREILNHTSVRGLMTHGGMSSLLEATYSGKPLIIMPLFADHDYQAYRVQVQEIGVKVEAAEFSEDILYDAIWKILNDQKLTQNMKIRSKIFKDRQDPTITAMEAIEYVLRHEDLSPLKPMQLDQTFYIRQNIDIYAFILIINLIISYLILKSIQKLISYIY